MLANPAPLTPVQLQVLSLLATGSTVTAAAEKADIHRNTIANWRRSSDAFRSEYHNLRSDQADFWRDGLQALAPLALETLRYAMANMNTPPGVRVRAALAILNTVMTLPPVQSEPDPHPATPQPEPQTVDSTTKFPDNVQPSASAQPAQSCTTPTSQTDPQSLPNPPQPHNPSSFPAHGASVY